MPLLLAAQNGDVATVKELLIAGAKVYGSAFFDNQETPMLATPLLGYGAQEFAFFRPSLDLVHVDHTRPRRPCSFPGVPTYEEYLAAGGTKDTLKTILPRLGAPRGEFQTPTHSD